MKPWKLTWTLLLLARLLTAPAPAAPWPASQAQVNAGSNAVLWVTPLTLKNWSGLASLAGLTNGASGVTLTGSFYGSEFGSGAGLYGIPLSAVVGVPTAISNDLPAILPGFCLTPTNLPWSNAILQAWSSNTVAWSTNVSGITVSGAFAGDGSQVINLNANNISNLVTFVESITLNLPTNTAFAGALLEALNSTNFIWSLNIGASTNYNATNLVQRGGYAPALAASATLLDASQPLQSFNTNSNLTIVGFTNAAAQNAFSVEWVNLAATNITITQGLTNLVYFGSVTTNVLTVPAGKRGLASYWLGAGANRCINLVSQ